MKSRERTVLYYDIKPLSTLRGIEAAPTQMGTDLALSLAKSHFDTGQAIAGWPDGGRHITLDAWEYQATRREHYLVISCADPSLSDVAFKHIPTGTARMAGKEDDEAIDYSAHVLLKLDPSSSSPALMLMTGGSGVSASKVASVLGHLVRHASKNPHHQRHFMRENPSGVAGSMLKMSVKFEVAGHPSRKLQEILRTGQIEEIELISDVDEELDVDSGFRTTTRILRVEPASTSGPLTLQRLRNLFSSDEQYLVQKAKISFKETPNSRTESHTFDTNDLERAFVKKELIRFDTDIQPRYICVNHTVIDKMRSAI